MWQRLSAFFIDTIQVVIFAVSIFLFIYLLVLQPHKIKGSSMEINFHDGEYLLTDKVTYRFGQPKQGDVIVFKAPPDYQEEFIKRIIGIPGDDVMVQGGKVYVNGKLLNETYLQKDLFTSPGSIATDGKTLKVPANSYFVMGDNRPHSFDGRNFGFITRDKITGRAWLVYWPLSNAGIVHNPF